MIWVYAKLLYYVQGEGSDLCVLCTRGGVIPGVYCVQGEGVIPDVYCVQGEESYLMCTVYRGRGVTLDVSDMMCTVFRGRCQT